MSDPVYREVVELQINRSTFERDLQQIRKNLRDAAIDAGKDLNLQIDGAIKFQRNIYNAAGKAVKEMYAEQIRQVKNVKAINADVAKAAIADAKEEARARDRAVADSLKAINSKRAAERAAHEDRKRQLIDEINYEIRKNQEASRSANRIMRSFASPSGLGKGPGPQAGNVTIPTPVTDTSGGLAGIGGLIGATTGVYTLITALNALRAAIGTVISDTEQFNVSLHSMATLMDGMEGHTGKFKDNLALLTKEADRLSVTFNKSMPDILAAFKSALSAGIDEKDVAEFTEISGHLANALGTDVDSVVNNLTTLKDSYHLTISDLKGVTNELFRAIDVGKIDIQSLNANLGRLIPTASSAGISITEMLAGVSSLSRIMPTNQAITALNKLIQDITHPSDKAAKAFEKFGIKTGEAQFQLKGLNGVLREIMTATGGKLSALSEIFPDERALRAAGGYAKVLELFDQHKQVISDAYNSQLAFNASLEATNTLGQNLHRTFLDYYNAIIKYAGSASEIINQKLYGKFGAPIMLGPKKYNNAGDPTEQHGVDWINANVSSTSEEMLDISREKLKNATGNQHWRKEVLENFDKTIDDIIARMDQRKQEITAHYVAMFNMQGLSAEDAVAKAQQEINFQNERTGDQASLWNLLNQRNDIYKGDTPDAKIMIDNIVGGLKRGADSLEKWLKENQRKIEEAERDKERIANATVDKFESLYKKDQEAFEHSQKAKLRIAEEFEKKISRLENARLDEFMKNQKLMNKMQDAADPANRQRNARKERMAATSELQQYVAGGGADRDRIELLADRIRAAIENEFGGADNKRSEVWTKMVEALTKLEEMGFKNATTNAVKEKDEKTKAAQYTRKSVQELTEEATKSVSNKANVKEEIVREVKAVISLEVDGTLSQASIDKLSDIMLKKFKTWEQQGIGDTGRPVNSYSDRNTKPLDE